MNDILKQIQNLELDNDFIRYIVKRVQKDDYRGWRSSQHNRYDISDVIIILENIYKVAEDGLIKIPLGDHKGITLSSEFDNYSKLIQLISSEMKSKKNEEKAKGTIDSLKKNFFVDFHRMGLIHRYDKNEKETDPWSKKHVHFVSLSETGLKFVHDNDLSNRFYLLTRAIDKLFENQMEDLLNTIYYSKYRHEKIGIYELMFVFTDEKISNEEKINLVESFRSLRKKRQKVVALIKQFANPKKFVGDKTVQRDFSNWKNKIQQILYLFRNTIYFDADEKGFKLNVGSLGIVPEIRQRSQTAKDNYFREHSLNKTINFELHHVIPFRYAKNKYDFKLIDDYKNLIYLHKSKHRKITKNNDKNVILYADNIKVKFKDFDNNLIVADNNKHAKYSKKKTTIMNNYNGKLLESIFEFKN